MTLKQGTLFGIIGVAVKVFILLVRIVLDDYYHYFYQITEILDIFAYVAFGIFFITLYKKQK